MSEELSPTQEQEMNVFQRIIGIFTSPREVFESIDRKPDWLIPYIITVVLVIGMQLLVMDIGIKDQLAAMEAKGITAEELSTVESQMNSPFKYLGLIMAPIGVLVVWLILAGIFLLAGNLMLGGTSTYKKILSMISWSGILGIISIPLSTFMILNKGTAKGVGTDLSVLLPGLAPGEPQTLMHLILARFDLFTIWQLILWTIALSVFYKTTTSKAAMPIVILWIIYCVLAIALTNLFSSFFGM
ncbi:MAG: YIP1 family protein [Calditrichaceae bacterium]|nr:YIP1 family protein [Calditrichaceae bacterium]MBN2710187.1 YIP1 family protein [Calditrichaceae bacterium]RQV94161.1 MAG: YIP1 family protein [Calditrichota bacterium]